MFFIISMLRKVADEQLIQRYLKSRDEKAFEELVKRYLPLVYGFVRKYVGDKDNASDITQEIFVKVWKNLKHFDPRKTSPRGEQAKSPAPYRTEGSGSGFRTWIFTIAKHTAIDWLKKRSALPFSFVEDKQGSRGFAESIADGLPSVFERLLFRETSKELAVAVGRLPADCATVINLRVNDDLSFREIAGVLKKPLNTVKSRYHRGVALLKTFLKNS